MQQRSQQHWGSNTLAAVGARAVALRPHSRAACSQAAAAGQQRHSQQQTAPPPPPKWQLDPLAVLPYLPEMQAPYLQLGPPPACKGSSMAVQLHVGQAPLRRGMSRKEQDIAICTQLFRKGLQRPNSTPTWAALHQHSDGVLTLSVLDSPAAQAAAAAAVAAGSLEVGNFTVPVSWARCMPPAGSIAVTVHQLPPQYARKGCVTALLQAAGQEGTVVCEFLGGSSWMGNAELSCPAADAVVAWVLPPAHDRLLTHLPSAFSVPDRPAVQIQVAGRPSLAPHLWLQLNQRQERQLQAALRAVGDAIAADAGQQPGSSAPPPPQVQHPAQQRQQQQQLQQQQEQQAPRQPPAPPSQHQQPQQQQLQQPGGSQHQDVIMQQAAPLLPPEQPQQQQQQQVEDADMASQEPQQPHPADLLPADPFVAQEGNAAWQQLQVEQMLQDAEQIADEAQSPAARQLSAAAKQQLQQAFLGRFSSLLQAQHSPPEREVRSWLRQQLRVPAVSYGGDSDSDDDLGLPAAAAAAEGQQEVTADAQPQGQQPRRDQRSRQRRDQQQPAAPLRQSPRSNAGQVSPQFAALFGAGSSQTVSTGKQRGGGKGRESQLLHADATSQPGTPATTAAAPPRRNRRTGGAAR